MLRVEAEAPPGAGTITHLDWDFDGSGRFVVSQSVEQGQTSVALTTTHAYARPGTPFAPPSVRLNRENRTSVVWGKGVSVRVDLGGRCIINKKMKTHKTK